MSERHYFRQLLAGRDFAIGNDVAVSMRNFTYIVGDRELGEVVVIDPAYAPGELIDMVSADGMTVTGVVATHFHPDHVGGELSGRHHIDGVAELLNLIDVPVHVQEEEVLWMTSRAGVRSDALVAHGDRDQLSVGSLRLTLIHTPGHTPGSQCIFADGRLLSGDTLFIDGCGRTDFPGGSAHEMYLTLSQRLSFVSSETVLYPGHLYSPEAFLSMGEVRERNVVLHPASEERWLAMFSS